MSVDAGDRSAELGQVSRSHAVLTFEQLDAQSESDPVSDVEPMYNMSPEVGESTIVLAAVRHDSSGCVEDTLQLVCRLPRSVIQ